MSWNLNTIDANYNKKSSNYSDVFNTFLVSEIIWHFVIWLGVFMFYTLKNFKCSLQQKKKKIFVKLQILLLIRMIDRSLFAIKKHLSSALNNIYKKKLSFYFLLFVIVVSFYVVFFVMLSSLCNKQIINYLTHLNDFENNWTITVNNDNWF